MRWQTLLTLLTLMTITESQLIDYEGACPTITCLMPRNPFYTVNQHCTLTVKTINPENKTYYQNTLELQTTISGGSGGVSCWYTINGGNNTGNQYDCAARNVTFPDGNVTLRAYAQDDVCTVYDTLDFNIILYANRDGGSVPTIWPLALPLALLLITASQTDFRRK